MTITDPGLYSANAPTPLESEASPYGSGLPSFVGSGGYGGLPTPGITGSSGTAVGGTVIGGTIFTPKEEESFTKYLTTEQQSEVLGSVQESLASSRASAALDRALARAASVKETLGEQYDILTGLRKEHYSDEREASEEAINTDYEGRGVYESSSREQSIGRALKAVQAAETYQSVLAKFQLDRDITNIDYDTGSQIIGTQQFLQDEQTRLARESIVSQFSGPNFDSTENVR